jgi:hypothetical protein
MGSPRYLPPPFPHVAGGKRGIRSSPPAVLGLPLLAYGERVRGWGCVGKGVRGQPPEGRNLRYNPAPESRSLPIKANPPHETYVF